MYKIVLYTNIPIVYLNIYSFNYEGLLAHMDQMRMDPKHQFAAQYVLTRAANERREREALLAAGLMNMSHFAMTAGAGLPGKHL